MRDGGSFVFGSATGFHRFSRCSDVNEASRATAPLQWNPPASDLSPVEEVGRRRLPLRGLARDSRAVVVVDPAARAARRARVAVRGGVGLRRLAGPPRRAEGPGE